MDLISQPIFSQIIYSRICLYLSIVASDYYNQNIDMNIQAAQSAITLPQSVVLQKLSSTLETVNHQVKLLSEDISKLNKENGNNIKQEMYIKSKDEILMEMWVMKDQITDHTNMMKIMKQDNQSKCILIEKLNQEQVQIRSFFGDRTTNLLKLIEQNIQKKDLSDKERLKDIESLKKQMQKVEGQAKQYRQQMDKLNQRVELLGKQNDNKAMPHKEIMKIVAIIIFTAMVINWAFFSKQCSEPSFQAKLMENEDLKMENNIHFQTTLKGNSLFVKYKEGSWLWSNWHGFLYPMAIEVGKVSKLTIRQVKSKNKEIMYGISTDAVKGMKDPYDHMECRSYYASLGHVVQDEGNRKVGPVLEDGNTITIIADLIKWKITWEINNKEVAYSFITERMKKKNLYFIVSMKHRDDLLEMRRF